MGPGGGGAGHSLPLGLVGGGGFGERNHLDISSPPLAAPFLRGTPSAHPGLGICAHTPEAGAPRPACVRRSRPLLVSGVYARRPTPYVDRARSRVVVLLNVGFAHTRSYRAACVLGSCRGCCRRRSSGKCPEPLTAAPSALFRHEGDRVSHSRLAGAARGPGSAGSVALTPRSRLPSPPPLSSSTLSSSLLSHPIPPPLSPPSAPRSLLARPPL